METNKENYNERPKKTFLDDPFIDTIISILILISFGFIAIPFVQVIR